MLKEIKPTKFRVTVDTLRQIIIASSASEHSIVIGNKFENATVKALARASRNLTHRKMLLSN